MESTSVIDRNDGKVGEYDLPVESGKLVKEVALVPTEEQTPLSSRLIGGVYTASNFVGKGVAAGTAVAGLGTYAVGVGLADGVKDSAPVVWGNGMEHLKKLRAR